MYIYKCDKVVDIILHINMINKLTQYNDKLIRLNSTVKILMEFKLITGLDIYCALIFFVVTT